LGTGERPGAVTVGALVAAALALGNLIAFAAGLKIRGRLPNAEGVIAFSVLMGVASVGMWRLRYWAVLGFQALLALIIIGFGLSLVVASSIRGLVIAVVVIVLAGWLFYRLVRAMARIQMPERRPRD
jgi:hypothetical protein